MGSSRLRSRCSRSISPFPARVTGRCSTLLGDRWPEFAAYAVSFFTIGIIWVNHHARFNLIVYVDRTLLFLNLVLLLFVVLIPFATATAAAYLTSGSEDFARRDGALRSRARGDVGELRRHLPVVARVRAAAMCRCLGISGARRVIRTLHRRAAVPDRVRRGVHQRTRRAGAHRDHRPLLRLRSAPAGCAGRQGARRVDGRRRPGPSPRSQQCHRHGSGHTERSTPC